MREEIRYPELGDIVLFKLSRFDSLMQGKIVENKYAGEYRVLVLNNGKIREYLITEDEIVSNSTQSTLDDVIEEMVSV